jgi:hypothetical protein
MNSKRIIAAVLTAGLLLTATQLFAGETVVATPKLTEKEAGKIALKKVPHGKVQGSELEMSEGVLVYSVDVSLPDSKSIIEVQINAVTGAVVDVAVEGPAEQAKEAAEDAKAEAKEKDDEKEKK